MGQKYDYYRKLEYRKTELNRLHLRCNFFHKWPTLKFLKKKYQLFQIWNLAGKVWFYSWLHNESCLCWSVIEPFSVLQDLSLKPSVSKWWIKLSNLAWTLCYSVTGERKTQIKSLLSRKIRKIEEHAATTERRRRFHRLVSTKTLLRRTFSLIKIR